MMPRMCKRLHDILYPSRSHGSGTAPGKLQTVSHHLLIFCRHFFDKGQAFLNTPLDLSQKEDIFKILFSQVLHRML